MREHITFDSIDCKYLQYVKASESWVCLECFLDIDDVNSCMRCKFSRMRDKEKAERRRKSNGRVL